jgi:hypothetical protein
MTRGLLGSQGIIGLSVNAGGENQDAMRQAGAALLLTKEGRWINSIAPWPGQWRGPAVQDNQPQCAQNGAAQEPRKGR